MGQFGRPNRDNLLTGYYGILELPILIYPVVQPSDPRIGCIGGQLLDSACITASQCISNQLIDVIAMCIKQRRGSKKVRHLLIHQQAVKAHGDSIVCRAHGVLDIALCLFLLPAGSE